GVEIRSEPGGIRREPRQALSAGDVTQQGVTQGNAHVTQHRRIGQVALPARDRQLVRKMAQERVGKTEISLRILEVDRVDLVRHGRRSDLALADLLPKISERNIPPDVAVEVDDDRVHARKSVEQRRHAIVRLDLRSERVELEPELAD